MRRVIQLASTIFRQVQEHGMKFLLSERYVGTLYLAAGSLPYNTCTDRVPFEEFAFYLDLTLLRDLPVLRRAPPTVDLATFLTISHSRGHHCP